jgi:hypothetical protein
MAGRTKALHLTGPISIAHGQSNPLFGGFAMTHWYSLLLAAMTMLTLPGASHADVLPFYSRNRVQVLLHFENLDQYPKFDFYVKYGVSPDHQFLKLEQVRLNSSAQLWTWGIYSRPGILGCNPTRRGCSTSFAT